MNHTKLLLSVQVHKLQFGILLTIALILVVCIRIHCNIVEKTQKMLIVGDSIGIGTGASNLDLKWYKFLPVFMEEEYNVKLEITNVSMGGNTSFAGYSRIMDLKEDDFDYVIVCYGENDRLDDFSLFYESILRAIYWKWPESKIITILESSQRKYTEKMKVIQQLSNHYHAQIADTIEAFNTSGMPYETLTDDGTHPNDKGQQIYFETVKDVLLQIHSMEEGLDSKDILPVNVEVERFKNYQFYGAEGLQKINGNELELEIAKTEAMVGISYTPVMGENKIKVYADDKLVFEREYNWEHPFIQDYIELTGKERVEFSKLKFVFETENQRNNFGGVILTAMPE